MGYRWLTPSTPLLLPQSSLESPTIVLVTFTSTVTKHPIDTTERSGFIWAYSLKGCSPLLWRSMVSGVQDSWSLYVFTYESKRSECWGSAGFSVLLPYFIQAGPPSDGMVPPVVEWAFPPPLIFGTIFTSDPGLCPLCDFKYNQVENEDWPPYPHCSQILG